MPICVVFGDQGARVLKNPENYAELAGLPHVLVDPDLSDVVNTPPHLWRINGGKIVAVEEGSSEANVIEQKLVDEGKMEPALSKWRILSVKLRPYIIALAGAVVGFILGKL
jgi:hypothetical protein